MVSYRDIRNSLEKACNDLLAASRDSANGFQAEPAIAMPGAMPSMQNGMQSSMPLGVMGQAMSGAMSYQ